jgi:Tfp pilus assembly protein PilF
MTSIRLTVVFKKMVPALWMILSAWPLITDAAPRKPVLDTEVVERLPLRTGDATTRELAVLQAAAKGAGQDPQAASTLAQRYFDLAVARGDPRYVGYAEAVVARFAEPLPPSLHVVRGQLRQYRHDFAGALDDFAGALAQDPGLSDAHAWRAAIFLVQADYLGAQKECDALNRLERFVLYGGCTGLVQAYGGKLDSGYRTLQKALANTMDAGNRLWLLTRLGEVAEWHGQPKVAEKHYRDALGLGRDDGYLLAAWGDFLLDGGRPEEVLKQLAGWEASDNLLLRLAEAEAALKRPGAARLAQMLEDRFAAAKQRGDTTHQAEEARYQLRLRGNAKEALRLAAENYRVQREPRDARILLEAAIAAGDAAAANPVRDWLQASGFEDARLRRLAQELCNAVSPCTAALVIPLRSKAVEQDALSSPLRKGARQ